MPTTTIMKDNILNYCFGRVTFDPANPATLYFGLSNDLVTVAGITSVAEPPEAYAYARVAFTNDQSGHWSNSSLNTLHNDEDIVFPISSGGAWGTILSIFIADASTYEAGNVLWFQTLASSLVVQNNTQVTFVAGTIIITM